MTVPLEGIEKIISLDTYDQYGRCFAEAIELSPRGGGLTKIASHDLHPELRRYMSTLCTDPRYQYVLMTPMGSFEFWGMNVNGDIFPEVALKHDHHKDDPQAVIRALEEEWLTPFGKRLPPLQVREFGYRTFEQANRYKHHVNKNPELSYGVITFSVFNKNMHRVELVVRHDREKAKRVGAHQIIADLDAGIPRQISMGCKVPFDVCTVCGNIAKTNKQYCNHLRFEMGTVRPNGVVVGAVNFFPRFFDLSDVLVPAAKESGVLMKIASAQTAGQFAQKLAATKKATIKKNILPNTGTAKALQHLSSKEPDLPMSALKCGLPNLIRTSAPLGMVLKPREFQYSFLNDMGRGDLARRMWDKGEVFDSSIRSRGGVMPLSGGRLHGGLLRLLKRSIPYRSMFSPHLPERSIKIMMIKITPREETIVGSPLMDKVASAYADYRSSLRTLPSVLENIVTREMPFFSENFFSDILSESFTKTASFNNVDSEELISSYLYNIYHDNIETTPNNWLRRVSPNGMSATLFGKR